MYLYTCTLSTPLSHSLTLSHKDYDSKFTQQSQLKDCIRDKQGQSLLEWEEKYALWGQSLNNMGNKPFSCSIVTIISMMMIGCMPLCGV